MPNEKKKHRGSSPVLWFIIFSFATAIVTALGPAEKTLGTNARVVYLHGVWVWTALAGFIAAALAGVVALVFTRPGWHAWSRALGRTGLIFWITYLPVSLWAMQTNWNGLFLAEPRWKFAFIFAISGLLFQVGLSLIDRPSWTSAGNILFISLLFAGLLSTENVMHPPSPILNSEAPRIQIFYITLLILMLLTAWQVARWLYQPNPLHRKSPEKTLRRK